MSVSISVRLPEFTARQLDALAKRTNLSKTDLIIQGLESVIAAELDKKVAYLIDEDFNAALDFIEKPMPAEEEQKLRTLMSKRYVWEEPHA